MNLYKRVFLAEGDAQPGFDTPLKKMFKVQILLFGKLYKTTTVALDVSHATRNVISRIAQDKGNADQIRSIIYNAKENPHNYALKCSEV